MGRLIFYIIILLFQFLFAAIKPLLGKSTAFQRVNRRIHALKSDLRPVKRKRR